LRFSPRLPQMMTTGGQLMQRSTWTLYVTPLARGRRVFDANPEEPNIPDLFFQNRVKKWWALSLQTRGKNEFLAKWYSVPGEKVSNSGPLFFSQVSNRCRVSDECLSSVESSRWPLHKSFWDRVHAFLSWVTTNDDHYGGPLICYGQDEFRECRPSKRSWFWWQNRGINPCIGKQTP
jgi:hypothetical protein